MPRCRSRDVVLLALLAAPAWGGDPPPLKFEARIHVERGMRAYGDGHYEEAIRELSQAYKIDPRREILFNWAQAERLSGDCAAAVPLYEEFLTLDPPKEQRAQARRLIEKCGVAAKMMEPEPAPQPGPEPKLEPEPEPLPERARARARARARGPVSERQPWYKDTWGDALVGVGVVSLGLGATFYAISSKAFDDAAGAASYQDYDARWDQAAQTRRIGVIGLVAGGALVAAGVGRWVWVGVQETDQGGVVLVGGGF